ncbi:hypothetical protein [Gilliamella sp. Pas-s25]|uniref:hypothetical protein n=1 Tax=Gilliamella sp. Pas-s25 TaxID=2687310 RepID=UPI00135E5101|nr:hypothetical protein [Gilliamella sp. Pas-s25]MWP61146.1 hypothetical protein [Gilliamella sp. Pas-s25]
MNKASFFTLPIIGGVVYFLLSCFLRLCFAFLRPESSISFETLGYLFPGFLFYFFRNNLVDTLWIFGLLSLVFYYANIHIVNKTNTVLLIVMMAIFTTVAELIQQSIIVYFYESPILPMMIMIIPSVVFCFLLYSLLIYYLTNFFEKFFVKSNQPFAITETNSSNIHFILFSTFICFLLIKEYMLIVITFDWRDSDFLKAIYIGAILIGLFLSKNCFKKPFNKIQSEKLIKSVFVSAILIFICLIVYFISLYHMPIRFYINATTLIRVGRSLLLLILLIVLICLIINKVTKHYFLKQK